MNKQKENIVDNFKKHINEISDDASVKRDVRRTQQKADQKKQAVGVAKKNLAAAQKRKADFNARADAVRKQFADRAAAEMAAARKKVADLKAKRNK